MIVNDGAAAVIDPLRAFVERYEADAADLGADVEYVLDTHIHADHISGLRELAAATGATAVLPAAAADRGALTPLTCEPFATAIRSLSVRRRWPCWRRRGTLRG